MLMLDSECSGTLILSGTEAPFSNRAVSCSTWVGDITIVDVPIASATASGLPLDVGADPGEVVIDVYSLREIQGDLYIGNFTPSGAPPAADGTPPDAVSLVFSNLDIVNGTLTVQNIPAKTWLQLNYTGTWIDILYLDNVSLWQNLDVGQGIQPEQTYYLPSTANPRALFLANTNVQYIALTTANKVYAWDNPLLNNITLTGSPAVDVRVKGNGNDLHVNIGNAVNASLRLEGIDTLTASSLSQLVAWEDLEGYTTILDNYTYDDGCCVLTYPIHHSITPLTTV